MIVHRNVLGLPKRIMPAVAGLSGMCNTAQSGCWRRLMAEGAGQ